MLELLTADDDELAGLEDDPAELKLEVPELLAPEDELDSPLELLSELDETPLLDPEEDGPADEELASMLELLAAEDDEPDWLEDDVGAELELDDPDPLVPEDEFDGALELLTELDETLLLDPDEEGTDEDDELAGTLELLADDDEPDWLDDDDGDELELEGELLALEVELDGTLELLMELDEPPLLDPDEEAELDESLDETKELLDIDELLDDGPLELPLLDELPDDDPPEPELDPTLELLDELPEQPSQQQQPAGWWNTHAPSPRVSPPSSSEIVTVRT